MQGKFRLDWRIYQTTFQMQCIHLRIIEMYQVPFILRQDMTLQDWKILIILRSYHSYEYTNGIILEAKSAPVDTAGFSDGFIYFEQQNGACSMLSFDENVRHLKRRKGNGLHQSNTYTYDRVHITRCTLPIQSIKNEHGSFAFFSP